jgi:hypothetical protein
MEAVARQFAAGRKCLVIRNGWFSYRWTQIFDMGKIPSESIVLKARPAGSERQAAYAPPPIAEVVAPYTSFRVADISFITRWKARDMWLSARSVNTTEYSSNPSGSTFGNKPGMVHSRKGRGTYPRVQLNILPLRRWRIRRRRMRVAKTTPARGHPHLRAALACRAPGTV